MDTIFLKGLRLFGKIGVFESEKTNGQVFIVNVEMRLDLSAAGKSDDLSLTINYAEVYELARDLMSTSNCDLIETYAEQLSTSILEKYSRAKHVRVEVNKPDAPITGEFDSVGISIERSRDA